MKISTSRWFGWPTWLVPVLLVGLAIPDARAGGWHKHRARGVVGQPAMVVGATSGASLALVPATSQLSFVQPATTQLSFVQPATTQLSLVQPATTQLSLVQPATTQLSLVQPAAARIAVVQPSAVQVQWVPAVQHNAFLPVANQAQGGADLASLPSGSFAMASTEQSAAIARSFPLLSSSLSGQGNSLASFGTDLVGGLLLNGLKNSLQQLFQANPQGNTADVLRGFIRNFFRPRLGASVDNPGTQAGQEIERLLAWVLGQAGVVAPTPPPGTPTAAAGSYELKGTFQGTLTPVGAGDAAFGPAPVDNDQETPPVPPDPNAINRE